MFFGRYWTRLITGKAFSIQTRLGDFQYAIVFLSFETSTRNVTETWENIKSELLVNKNGTNCTGIGESIDNGVESQEAGFYSLLRAYESLQNGGDNEFDGTRDDDVGGNEMEQTGEEPHNVIQLSEEQKKLLWESLRLGGEEEQVPE